MEQARTGHLWQSCYEPRKRQGGENSGSGLGCTAELGVGMQESRGALQNWKEPHPAPRHCLFLTQGL